jgi:hypothetical protein
VSSEFKIEKEFVHKGLRCVIVVQGGGYRCGYVGVPKEHPLHNKHYRGEVESTLNVHGGITYSNGNGYPVDGDEWWFGFDCAHAGDARDYNLMSDEHKEFYSSTFKTLDRGIVRSLDYVVEECRDLANQLVEAKHVS